ncbi:hypothetical protein GCM10010345_80010 [Streptomyces canarius]|uniref:Uncharacterized protein n=1 Tax=Streptomyces canarius TaxID=285453 RepID=A0ABQ3D7Y2_9ACTN|nr:hypothetical protein GCM10010345_80010 [Streptomyces canarius]
MPTWSPTRPSTGVRTALASGKPVEHPSHAEPAGVDVIAQRLQPGVHHGLDQGVRDRGGRKEHKCGPRRTGVGGRGLDDRDG